MNEGFKEQIEKTIREVMGIDIRNYPPERKISEISEWDSFNNLMLISRFQEEMGVEFTAVEIDEVQTIIDLYNILDRKKN